MTLSDAMLGVGVATATTIILFAIKEFWVDPRRDRHASARDDAASRDARRADHARAELPERRRIFASYLTALQSFWHIGDFDSAEGRQAYITSQNSADDMLTEARFCVLPETLQAMDETMKAAIMGSGLRSDALKARDSGARHEANEYRKEYGATRAKMINLMDQEIADLSRNAGVDSEGLGE